MSMVRVMMVLLALTIISTFPAVVLAAEESESLFKSWINADRYSWVAGGYSQDIQEFGTRGLTVSGGRMPVETGFGYQAYVEGTKLDDPKDDGMVYTLGIEPLLFKYHWAYIALGLSVSDRQTAVSGTLWNFQQRYGVRYKPKNQKWFIDGSILHRSHCSRCGIEEDKVNTGMTSLNIQFGMEF